MIPSKKKLRAMLKDENDGIKMYRKLGWKAEEDEEKHKRFIEMLLKKKGV